MKRDRRLGHRPAGSADDATTNARLDPLINSFLAYPGVPGGPQPLPLYRLRVETRGMARTLTIPAHLPVAQLERRYRAAPDPIARGHWQIVWLLARGDPTAAVAEVT